MAAAAEQLVRGVDHGKGVRVLGNPFPLPIGVRPFGSGCTGSQIETRGGKAAPRQRDEQVFMTEGGHSILDWHIDRIEDPAACERHLHLILGAVETGLLVGRTSVLAVGTPQGIDVRHAEKNRESL